MNVVQPYVDKVVVSVVRTKDRKVGFFDILNARSYKLECVKRPPVRVGGRSGAPSYSHDVMLMVYVVVFESDGVWVDDVFLVDDDLLTILVMVGKTDGVVELVAIGDYGVWVHRSERGFGVCKIGGGGR